MPQPTLTITPIAATIHEREFDLLAELVRALSVAEIRLRTGDILAISQ